MLSVSCSQCKAFTLSQPCVTQIVDTFVASVCRNSFVLGSCLKAKNSTPAEAFSRNYCKMKQECVFACFRGNHKNKAKSCSQKMRRFKWMRNLSEQEKRSLAKVKGQAKQCGNRKGNSGFSHLWLSLEQQQKKRALWSSYTRANLHGRWASFLLGFRAAMRKAKTS